MIMRVSIFKLIFLFVTTSFLSAKETSAQEILDRPVTLNVKDVTLKSALSQIENAVRVRFSYSRNIINLNQKVNINSQSEVLAKVLQRLLNPLAIDYQVVDDQILLYNNKKRKSNHIEAVSYLAFSDEELAVQYLPFQGRVISSVSGQGLPDVSVQIKNTNVGTTTDRNGSFSLNIPNGSDVLVISYVGYLTKEVAVNNQSFLEITLNQDVKIQEEVVVVGYGTQKSKSVTGAVAKIGNKQIKEVPVLGLDQAILGRVAGVQVTENSAEPGGEVSIRIRGIASITSGIDPLVVVDGVPMSVNLNTINPNDIESIDLLKDAASTAIYGSRASAGVILVTTKRGKNTGKATVSFDAYTARQYVAKKIPLLNGPQFAKLANENLVNGGQTANPEWADPSKVLDTDWQDAIFNRGAPMHNANVSIAGGSEKLRSF